MRYLISLALTFLASGCAHMEYVSPLASLERAMIFHPTEYPARVPDIPNLAVEDAWIESPDGVKLHGLFVEHPNAQGVALFCHGNAGTVAHRIETLAVLNHRNRLSVLAFDYQGYGKSEGKPSQFGILRDARAARTWLAKRAGVAESEVILMGRSVDLASEDGAKGLVLASTFTSLPDVAHRHLPWVPVHMLMTHRLNSLEKIKRYSGPLLYSHGDADEVIPYDLGKKLYDAAPGPKQFVSTPGGTHNSRQTDEYRQAFDQFILAISRDEQ